MDPQLLNHPNYAQPTVKPKLEAYLDGSENIVDYVKRYKPKIVHNVDTVLSTISFGRAHRDFEKYYFAQLFGNHAFLVAATNHCGCGNRGGLRAATDFHGQYSIQICFIS